MDGGVLRDGAALLDMDAAKKQITRGGHESYSEVDARLAEFEKTMEDLRKKRDLVLRFETFIAEPMAVRGQEAPGAV